MKILRKIGFLAGILTLLAGWLYSYQRGAHDFSVFFTAWQHAWSGQGALIYKDSPDRYLYAPGFAWALAPWAMLPRWLALALWNLLKTSLLIAALRSLIQPLDSRRSWLSYFWIFLMITRPLLIDFQYGQINSIILSMAILALTSISNPSWKSATKWLGFSFLAMTKVMCLPLLIIPWIHPSTFRIRVASILGAMAAFLLPVFWLGIDGLHQLILHWQEALISRGFPLESHNQSFAAVLHHWFSGEPIRIIALYGQIQMGWKALSSQTLSTVGLSWGLIVLGLLLTIVINKKNTPPLRWIALLCGGVFLPSHLVWKPYFIFGLPAVTYLVAQSTTTPRKSILWGLGTYFVLLNLTSVDFLGPRLAAYLEAGGVFLVAHFLLMGMTLVIQTPAPIITLGTSDIQHVPAPQESAPRRG